MNWSGVQHSLHMEIYFKLFIFAVSNFGDLQI